MARFHLGNGARLERLNWLGDTSRKGLAEAAGMMVNYLYALDLDRAESEAYAERGEVIAAPSVRRLAASRPLPASRNAMTNFYDSVAACGHPANRQFASLTDGRHYTYGDIDAVSARFANVLTELGVRPDDRVAVQVPKSIEALMLYLATLRVGAIFLPLNTGYTPAEVETFLVDAAPRLFVCDPDAEAELRPVAGRAGAGSRPWASGAPRCLGRHAGRPGPCGIRKLPTVPRNADDLAALLYTSRTTGRSKGAMLTHENLRSNAEALMAIWRFAAADALLHALPIFHTHGLFVATNITLACRLPMLFLPRFEVDEVLDLLPEASVMMGVPTFYTRLLASPRPYRGAHRPYAPLHLRIRAARARGPCAMARPHRSRHSRTLRHDRDRHDHLQSL